MKPRYSLVRFGKKLDWDRQLGLPELARMAIIRSSITGREHSTYWRRKKAIAALLQVNREQSDFDWMLFGPNRTSHIVNPDGEAEQR